MSLSMTGYGASEGCVGDVAVTVRVRSVNQRFLDINVKLPSVWADQELELRRKIQSQVLRGKVEVFVQRSDVGAAVAGLPKLNVELLQAYRELYLEGIHQVTGVHAHLTADECREILVQPGVLFVDRAISDNRDEQIRTLMDLVDQALAAFLVSRAQEGAGIVRRLQEYLLELQRLIAELKTQTADLVADHVAKLKKRISDLLAGQPLEEVRFAQEVAYLGDRYDVTEELQRLEAHAQAVEELLATGVQGKKLDFLCQELFREANTLGAKCQSVTVQHAVVNLKGLIEKLREQAQNIE